MAEAEADAAGAADVVVVVAAATTTPTALLWDATAVGKLVRDTAF